MTAVSKPVVFSWIPKGGGKGGQFSNATSHDTNTDMLKQVRNLAVAGGHWVGMKADLLFSGALKLIGSTPNSFHCFNAFSNTSQTFHSFLMVSYHKGTVIVGDGRGYFTSGAAFTSLDFAPWGVTSNAGAGPTWFQTVKNRCYASDGRVTAAGLGKPGPRIYYDQLGTGVALVGANWGLPTPVPNLQVSPAPNSYQTGTCTVTAGSPLVTVMSFDPRVNLAEGMPFYIETSAGSGQYYEFIIKSCDSAVQLTLTTNWIGLGYALAKCQGNYGSMSWGSSQPNIATGTATTHGNTTIDVIAGFDALAVCRIGYRILVESAANSQVWNAYIITNVVSSTQVTVSSATIESYAGAQIRVDLPATTSGISADSSYLYAISYYDSARGHIGNPGPRFNVNWGPPFNKRINLLIQNITDAPSGPTSGFANDWTYDKIILWRTASNGAALFSRVLLSKAGGGGIQSFTDNLSDDTQLGLVGPVGSAISSRVTAHGPPPPDLAFATYWEGRFFGASTTNPGLLYWTATAGQEIDNYGVAEECWPPTNLLPVPESDGTITGIKTVGAALIVETQNNLYQVDYNTSNTTSIFRLKRLSAKGSGTSHFATATLPGEDAQSGDILVHFGNDQRLYLLYGAGGDVPISYPVQDVFDLFIDPSLVRVGIRHDENSTYIVVLANQTSVGQPPPNLLYDIDRKLWLVYVGPNAAYTEGLFNGVTTAFVGGSPNQGNLGGNVYKMNADPPPWAQSVSGGFTLQTQVMTPPGIPRLDEKNLQAVLIWAENIDTDFQVIAVPDEGVPVFLARLDMITNPFLRMYADTPNCRVYVPSTGQIVTGRTFTISVTLVPGASIPRIYEVMGVWSTTVEPSDSGGVV